MAEFLIKNFDSTHPAPLVNEKLEKAGDIVEVRPDGSVYGRLEKDPNKFLIVRCPGMDLESSRAFAEAYFDPLFFDPERPDEKRILKIRRYSIADGIPFLGPYHVTGNEYEIPPGSQAGNFLARLVDKAI